MNLENIIIENYRQFDTAELAFDQGITFLAGANNSGGGGEKSAGT
mgnify:CR=1 FL=1